MYRKAQAKFNSKHHKDGVKNWEFIEETREMIREVKAIANTTFISELKIFPNQGILWEIIEKNQSGKIYELPDEAILIMENCPDPFVFISGILTDEAVNNVISLIGALEFPMLYCKSKRSRFIFTKGLEFSLPYKFTAKDRERGVIAYEIPASSRFTMSKLKTLSKHHGKIGTRKFLEKTGRTFISRCLRYKNPLNSKHLLQMTA